MKALVLLASLLLLAGSSSAHTTVEQSFVCPIDGKKFKQAVDASGTRFGMRLDSKPLGEIAAPWSLPQCPQCKFVFYQESFDKAAIRKLKPFIQSERYRAASLGHPSYFALASIQEFLDLSSLVIGYSYLEASWQVESDPKACQQALTLAYQHLSAGLAKLKPTEDQFVNMALICGELERRLEKFDEAAHRFQALKTNENFKEAGLQKVIDRQLILIGKKDSAPHAVDESQDQEAGVRRHRHIN